MDHNRTPVTKEFDKLLNELLDLSRNGPKFISEGASSPTIEDLSTISLDNDVNDDKPSCSYKVNSSTPPPPLPPLPPSPPSTPHTPPHYHPIPLPPPPLSKSCDDKLYTKHELDEHIQKVREEFAEEVKIRELNWKEEHRKILIEFLQQRQSSADLSASAAQASKNQFLQDNSCSNQYLQDYSTSNQFYAVSDDGKPLIVELASLDPSETGAPGKDAIEVAIINNNNNNNNKIVEDISAEKAELEDELDVAERTIFDAYRRVETLKQTVDKLLANEQTLKKHVLTLTEKVEGWEDRYEKLKTHAEETVDSANTTIDNLRQQHKVSEKNSRPKK